MTARLRPISASWDVFRELVISKDAPRIQLVEMRRAFFAGAEAFLQIQLGNVSAGLGEPTDDDMRLMDDLQADILEFAEEVKAGRA